VAETLTLIEKTVHMKASEAFRAIPTEPLAQLAARANVGQFDRGETVFREGDDDQGVFMVIEGSSSWARATSRLVAPGPPPGTDQDPRTKHQGLTTTSNCRLLSQLG